MTGRDIEPPDTAAGARPRWELLIGYYLEEVFLQHTDLAVITVAANVGQEEFPGAARTRRFLHHELLSLGLSEEDLAVFERLGVRRTSEIVKQARDPAFETRHRELVNSLETLMAKVGHAIPEEGGHCYSVGVMLSRFGTFVRMVILMSPTAPFAKLGETIGAKYRSELNRTAQVLTLFIMILLRSGTLLRSGHADLQRALRAFADRLGRSADAGIEPSRELLGSLQQTLHAVGVMGTEGMLERLARQTERHPGRSDEPAEPLPRTPTDVPHSPADADELAAREKRLSTALASDPDASPRLHREAIALRDECRRRLGPLHETTILVEISLCRLLAAVGERSVAGQLALDIADTLTHHLGHADALTVGAQHACLSVLTTVDGPAAAKRYFDTHLRWLIDTDPRHIPPELHTYRDSRLLARFASTHSPGTPGNPIPPRE